MAVSTRSSEPCTCHPLTVIHPWILSGLAMPHSPPAKRQRVVQDESVDKDADVAVKMEDMVEFPMQIIGEAAPPVHREYHCHCCGRAFRSRAALISHQRHKHPVDEPPSDIGEDAESSGTPTSGTVAAPPAGSSDSPFSTMLLDVVAGGDRNVAAILRADADEAREQAKTAIRSASARVEKKRATSDSSDSPSTTAAASQKGSRDFSFPTVTAEAVAGEDCDVLALVRAQAEEAYQQAKGAMRSAAARFGEEEATSDSNDPPCTTAATSLQSSRDSSQPGAAGHYICEDCGRCFSTRSGLSKHKCTRLRPGDVFCRWCGHGFPGEEDLRMHSCPVDFEEVLPDMVREGGGATLPMMVFPCPSCGHAFRRRYDLERHLDDGATSCLRRQATKKAMERASEAAVALHRRRVGRSLQTSISPFLLFLKSMVVKQQNSLPGPVMYVPFADPSLIPWDFHRLGCILRGQAGPLPYQSSMILKWQARMVAAAAIATVGWTARWVNLAGFPPAPGDREGLAMYIERMEMSLMVAWEQDVSVMNEKIISCNTKSTRSIKNPSLARLRHRHLVNTVRGIVERLYAAGDLLIENTMDEIIKLISCQGMPADGYTMKLARGFISFLVPIPRGSGLHLGSGTRNGLATLTGEMPHVYKADSVMADRLQQVKRLLELKWDDIGPSVLKPHTITIADINTMLCVWSAAGCVPVASSHDHVMRAVG